jgi:hypothetical protein
MKTRLLPALLVTSIILFAFAGCRTTGGDEDKVPAGTMIPFQPAGYLSRLHLASGAYPNLFAGDSHAIWVGPEIISQRQAEPGSAEAASAVMLNENFLVIEVRLESVFADMSIAYDVVGLRGLYVYLLTPDGRKVSPAQIEIGSDLEEKAQGTLRVFARNNRLIFNRNELQLAVPAYGAPPGTVRLMMEGYNSVFYFEWAPVLPTEIGLPPIKDRKSVKKAQEKKRDIHENLRDWMHTFD